MFPPRLLAVVALAVVGACGAELGPLPIALEFREELPGQCPSDQCSDYGLDCGAVISVRVFPGSSDPLTQAEPLLESCIALDAASDLCALSTAGLQLGDLPAERVRIEVAIWSPEDVNNSCPGGPMFDLGGLPLSTFDPQPAFAGSRVFDAGSESLSLASIELACFDSDPLGQCGGGQTEVTAAIDDIDTLLFAPALAAANLRVSVGVPREQPIEGGETVFVIDAADDFELELTRTVPVPQFAATVSRSFPDIACLQVLDVAPQSTTAVTCTNLGSSSAELELTGYLVGKPRVDQLLGLLGEPTFPAGGLVVGRVVDGINQPTGDVTITATTPTGGSAEILYISDDFLTFGTTGPTASHGFFVSRDAPFGTTWTATHLDGRVQDQAVATGLIQGKVTGQLRRYP